MNNTTINGISQWQLCRYPIWTLFTLLLLSIGSAAFASNDEAGHKVNFAYTESMNLENDLVTIRFRALEEGKTSAEVSQKINRQMQQAIGSINKARFKTIQTENYQIFPVYGKNRQIAHWRGQQTLRLEAASDQKISPTLQKLESLLSYQSLQFSLSTERRQKAQEQLLLSAIQGYQAKAKQIANAFGKQKFVLLQTDLQANHTAPVMHANSLRMEAMAASAEPALEEGSSQVTLYISGTMLLEND